MDTRRVGFRREEGLWGKVMNVGRGPAAGILAVKGAISPEMAVLL